MRARVWLVAITAVLAVPAVQADKLYKWVDQDGHVSYHDQPPTDEGYRVEEKIVRTKTNDTQGGSSEAAAKFPVVLYSAPKCTSCDEARNYLKRRGIPFEDKNVQGDRKLQDELIKQSGGLSVPTITIGSKVMRGYMESLIEGELDQAGYGRAEAPTTEEAAKAEQ